MKQKRIAIIGGGPAGLAAAATLITSEHRDNLHIELFEAGSRLGGRAASFVDRTSGVTLDTCQHVLMGCCTATIDFFRTVGLIDQFDVYDRYHFFEASGKCHDFAAIRGLPAPLHLLPGFWRLKYLARADRLRIMRSLMRLQKLTPEACADRTIGDWLREEGHSANACQRFWAVVLTSALSETLDRVSLAAARMVFVEGFLRSREAYQLWVPREPLGVMFDQRVGPWLENQGVVIHRSMPVQQLEVRKKGTGSICPNDSHSVSSQSKWCLSPFSAEFDQVISAVPCHRLQRLIETAPTAGEKGTGTICTSIKQGVSYCSKWSQSPFPLQTLEDAPITAVHLWFDRPVSELPHAVLVDQGGNWMFRPSWAEPNYAQVVISESRSMVGLSGEAKEEAVQRIAGELVQTVTQGERPKLLRSHTITHPRAVFSVTPESDRYRAETKNTIENLYLAGDWTATGWPSTIEGAIRSGNKAGCYLR